MILLVTASARAAECAADLEQATQQRVTLAASVPQAIDKLKAQEYEAMVIDQPLLEADPCGLDALLNHAGVAMPIYVNLALRHVERVVREVQEGLRRAAQQKKVAMRAAERLLRCELRDELTGILLSSDLALRQPAIPAGVADRVRSVQQLAQSMRSRLELR
jgi:hypothetical protein